MFTVYYYHDRLGKWIKLIKVKTRKEAEMEAGTQRQIWKCQTKIVEE